MKKLMAAVFIAASIAGCASKSTFIACDVIELNSSTGDEVSRTTKGGVIGLIAGSNGFSYMMGNQPFFQSPDLVNGSARQGGKLFYKASSTTYGVKVLGEDKTYVFTSCKNLAGY